MKDFEKMLVKANKVELKKYPELVEKKIRKNHNTSGSEIAILRKEIAHLEAELNVTPTQEFADYHVECENIKTETKNELEIDKE